MLVCRWFPLHPRRDARAEGEDSWSWINMTIDPEVAKKFPRVVAFAFVVIFDSRPVSSIVDFEDFEL